MTQKSECDSDPILISANISFLYLRPMQMGSITVSQHGQSGRSGVMEWERKRERKKVMEKEEERRGEKRLRNSACK